MNDNRQDRSDQKDFDLVGEALRQGGLVRKDLEADHTQLPPFRAQPRATQLPLLDEVFGPDDVMARVVEWIKDNNLIEVEDDSIGEKLGSAHSAEFAPFSIAVVLSQAHLSPEDTYTFTDLDEGPLYAYMNVETPSQIIEVTVQAWLSQWIKLNAYESLLVYKVERLP